MTMVRTIPTPFVCWRYWRSTSVRATFFMIGRFVRQRPEIARAVAAAGHLIGNHTMTPSPAADALARGCPAAVERLQRRTGRCAGHGGPLVSAAPRRTPAGYPALRPRTGPDDGDVECDGIRLETDHAGSGGTKHSARLSQEPAARATPPMLCCTMADRLRIGQDRSHTVVATDRLIPFWKNDFAQRGETCEFVTPEAWV